MLHNADRILKFCIYIVNVVLVSLSVLAVIKCIFVGFDIDEGYAVAQSYRLLMGDRMLQDMWEPHQLSAYASAVLMYPFLWMTSGETDGVIIYLRIIGSIIHLLIACGFYVTARKRFDKNVSLLISLVHLNFLPKWIVLPEFEILQYWATCLLFFSLCSWAQNHQKKYLVVSGIVTFMCILSYPTMMILYVICIIAIVYIRKGTLKEKMLDIVWYTMPEVLLGLGLLLYIFTYLSVEELIKYIGYIFMDESHATSLSYRIPRYAWELKEFIFWIFRRIKVVIPFCFFMVVIQIAGEKAGILLKERIIETVVFVFLLGIVGIFAMEHLGRTITEDKNQFYLYFRFLLVEILGCAGVLYYKKTNLYFWTGILPGFISIIAMVLITNMTLEVSMARSFVAVVITCFIIATLIKEKYNENIIIKLMGYGTLVVFVAGLIVCKLFLVRVTGCLPEKLQLNMSKIECGPAAGLLVEYEMAQIFNENTKIIDKYVRNDDTLLYFGCECINYMISDAAIATPSVQGTSAFDEMYLLYYQEHPEKIPTVIIIDKNFKKDSVYWYSDSNEIVLNWIMEEYGNNLVVETENLIIYRKNK